MYPAPRFPGEKKFAFSVFDDTDSSTIQNVRPVYDFLDSLGIKTTKSVWVYSTAPQLQYAAATLEDRDYLRFILHLKERGFEVGLHNVQNGDATRARTERGIEEFRERTGEYPKTHANHLENRENIYWGSHRLRAPIRRAVYSLGTRLAYLGRFSGHRTDSPYFWGDLCKEHVTYVRNFVFDEINLDRLNPSQPYHDKSKPFVNYWFSSTNGGDVKQFCRTISERNQDRLEAECGVCIICTHFASGFVQDGKLHPEFSRLMTRLASKSGWFVPVSTLLDHLRREHGERPISDAELDSIEKHWLRQRLMGGSI